MLVIKLESEPKLLYGEWKGKWWLFFQLLSDSISRMNSFRIKDRERKTDGGKEQNGSNLDFLKNDSMCNGKPFICLYAINDDILSLVAYSTNLTREKTLFVS